MAETHYDSTNIIVGTAAAYWGAVGTALPPMPPGAGAVPVPTAPVYTNGLYTSGWVPLGYTDAGIKFAYSVTNKPVNVDEEMAPLDMLPDAESLKVTLGLAEVTPENLNRALAATTISYQAAATGQAGTTTVTAGSKQSNVKGSLLLIGNGPKGMPRMVNLFQTVATSSAEFSYKRAEKIMLPAEFTGLALSTQPVGARLWQIIDKTANGM